MIALLSKECSLFSWELLAPWRLASLVFGLGLLIAGSVFLPQFRLVNLEYCTPIFVLAGFIWNLDWRRSRTL